MVDTSDLSYLAAIVGSSHIRTKGALALLDPGAEAANLGANALVEPASTQEVAEILRYCGKRGLAVVPQGGRTGLAQGAISTLGQLIVSLTRMNRIVNLDAEAATATVEAGVTLENLANAAAKHGLEPGIDLAARGSATIGGMISTNAGGIEAFRHGVMRRRVLGLEAVLADGTIISDLSRVEKCNEGYDVKQLFIGAEGTLGIVTQAVLKLEPAAKSRATALVAFDSAAHALRLFHHLKPLGLLAMEAMWRRYAGAAAVEMGQSQLLDFAEAALYAIVELPEPDILEAELAEAYEQRLVTGAIVAKSGMERRAIWRLREDSWAIDRLYPGGLWYDVSVPLRELDAYIGALEMRVAEITSNAQAYIIGHLGDGNLHITVAGPQPVTPFRPRVTEAVYAGLKDMGGSISAEHGIGLEKRDSLERFGDPGKLAVMRLLKRTLDPKNILNPGKVIPSPGNLAEKLHS
jgi:FAD/FMN-containing dehydrogenase